MSLLASRSTPRTIARSAIFLSIALMAGLPFAQSSAQDAEQTYDVAQPESFRDQLPAGATITEVQVFHDATGIHGLRLHYQLSNGMFNMLPIRGAAIGQQDTIVLEAGERIRAVTGTRDASGRLRTLKVITDRGESGPLGTTPGEVPFRLALSPNREFAGFQGYLGDVLRGITLVSRVASENATTASTAAAAPVTPAAPKALAIANPPASRTPIFKGWHLRSREFTCQSNGSEADNSAEVFGSLTLSFDAGDGVQSAFLMSLAEQYAVAMDCASKTALISDKFKHVDFMISVPPQTKSAGGFWFVSDLMEADDGSFIDPHDNLGGYETVQVPLKSATPAQTHSIQFSEPSTGNSTRLQILLDVTPIFE
jgi:hypothetical protein